MRGITGCVHILAYLALRALLTSTRGSIIEKSSYAPDVTPYTAIEYIPATSINRALRQWIGTTHTHCVLGVNRALSTGRTWKLANATSRARYTMGTIVVVPRDAVAAHSG